MSQPSGDAADIALVTRFLDLTAVGDVDAAADLLAPDVLYTNVGLPSIRGRERVRKLAGAALAGGPLGFEVYIHNTSADSGVVLNERTDVLTLGPWRTQFWVYGRFEVRDGLITVWRDSFDYLNITLASLRGLAGIFVPALRAKPPWN